MFLNRLESSTANYFSNREKKHYFGLWAAIIFLWVLFFPYAGIIHDSQIYTLQALYHTAPELYKNDIFLRYGSQDQFTLFGPLFAGAIKFVGLERSGAWLTLASQGLFFLGVFLLAKKIMPYGIAVFSVGLVATISSCYSAQSLLNYIELFATSRMLAEAFVLFSVIAWLDRKYIITSVMIIIALLIHPLIAAAGLILFCSTIYIMHWKSLTALAIAVILLIISAGFFTQILENWQFDAEWLSIVEHRNTMLFFHLWTIDDFSNALVPLISLVITYMFLKGEIERKLCTAALFAGVMGMLVQAIGSDLLHIKLITQGQAWRWLWIAILIAILLFPNLALQLWQNKTAGRTVLITLAAAWLMRSQLMGLVVAIWALALTAALKKDWGSEFFWAFSKWVGIILVLLPIGLILVVSHLHIYVIQALINGARLQDFPGLWHESAFVFYMFFLSLIVCTSYHNAARSIIAFGFLICSIFAFWFLGRSWLPESKLEVVYEQYEEVRQIIPVGEDVFALWPPVNTWIVLQRPNYLSGIQMAGVVFTRETAIEAERRRSAILSLCPLKNKSECDKNWLNWLPSVEDYSPFCRVGKVKFILSAAPINAKGLAKIPLSGDKPITHLYRCAAE